MAIQALRRRGWLVEGRRRPDSHKCQEKYEYINVSDVSADEIELGSLLPLQVLPGQAGGGSFQKNKPIGNGHVAG